MRSWALSQGLGNVNLPNLVDKVDDRWGVR